MINVFSRLRRELNNRGPTGFARFIALRLVQLRSDVLFEVDLRNLAGPGADASPYAVTIIDRGNFGSGAHTTIEKEVLVGGNLEYVTELHGMGQMLAATGADGSVASYAFVLFDSFYKRILGEARGTPIICNCVTLPAHRGQGLYPLLLRASCQRLAAQGYGRAIITCAPDNLASMRGIEKAGFRRVKTLHSLILFTRLIAAQRIQLASPAPDLART
jgi:GNAT superfamily N-acetyltransferase